MTIHRRVGQTPSWSCQVILKLIRQRRSQNLKFTSIQHEIAKVHLGKTENLLLSTKHLRHLKNWMICSNHIIKIMQTRKDTRSRVSWRRDGASKFSRKFNVFCACIHLKSQRPMDSGWNQQIRQELEAGKTMLSDSKSHTICKRAKEFITERLIPQNPFGTWSHSKIDEEEELKQELNLYLQSKGL